jgi:hypothetical protein
MKIYNPSGTEILDVLVDDSSVRYRSIMNDDSLTLNFSLTESIEIPLYSYVVFEGSRYTLWRPEEFKKNGTRNHEYTLTLHGYREFLKFVKFKDTSAKPYRLKFFLTGKPVDFMNMLVDSLNDKDGGWTVGSCIDASEKTLSFNHEYCLDVLARLATEFNTEYEFEGKKIHLRKVEKFKDDPLPLSYGKGNGFLPGVGRYNDGDKQPIGRLYVQGGERNIDFSTYGSKTLLLPKSATLEYGGKTYRTDADGMYITRDGNSNTAEDSFDAGGIYPSRVGTVTAVEVIDAEKNFYDIIDSTIPEALDYANCRIAGEKATIVFQTGALAGREFDIEQTDGALTGYIHAERRFKIVPAELDGIVMPGGVFVPAVGDKYAVFNIRMPEAYISDDPSKTGASWDMFREAVKYFAENEEDKFRFTGEMDGIWSKSRWLEIGGKIVPGGHVLFSDPQFQPDGILIRITAVKDYVNKPHKPEITLSNAPVSGSFSADLGKIEAEEVVREADKKDLIRYSKRQWRDAKETMSMLHKALLNFSGSINPLTVQTMQLLVGDESLQFRFVNSKTNPQPVTHNVAFNATTKVLTAAAGIIQHMTIGVTSLKKSHAASEYKYWDMTAYTSPALDPEKAYYLYARCATSGTTGIFLLSETVIGMESVANQYHFLLGILNSEQDDDRSFAPLYGYSEILPGRITTDRIVSQDGLTYFDLLNSVIGGRIKFLSSGAETDLEAWAENTETNIQEIASSTGGKMLYKDPTFKSGVNGTSRYNDAGGSTTFWERIAKPSDAPSDSTHIMRYRYEGAPSSPSFGGFAFQNSTRPNAVFIAKIIAKIPLGKQINWHNNAYGTGAYYTWLTSQLGTGKYETYIVKAVCGATGTFSSINFFAFSGGSGAFTVEVAYATVFDMTLYDDTADQAKQDAAAIQARIEEAEYLKSALKQATEIVGGLILSSIIAGRDTNEIVRSYLNGNPNLNPIAFAAGVENFGMANETQKNALRHDGSGFLANKKIEWDVNGNTDYSGNLKGVSGTFKTLNCVDYNGNIVGSIKFGSDGRIWFENCSIAHQAATGAFLTSDVWVRGVLGSFGRTALVITGTSYGYVYKGGLSGGSQYVSLSSGTASDGNTYYNIPLYSPTTESSGMPVDLVIINHGSTARYNLPYIPGKTITLISSRDQNSNISIYTNGRLITMSGGSGHTLACVGSNQYPDGSSWLGRGWQITGYNDNTWYQ